MQMHEAVQDPGLRLQLQCPVHYRCRNQHLGRSAGVDMAAFAVRWRCYRRPLNGNDNWQIARDDDVTAPKHNGRPRWLFHLPAWCHALRRHVKLPKAPADVASVDSSPCHMASFVNQRRSTADVTLHYVFSMTVPHPPSHPRLVVVIACDDFSPRDTVIYEHLYYAME